MSKQSAGIAKQILNLCDEIHYTQNTNLMQRFAERTLQTYRRNVIVDIDFYGDEVIAALMYLLSHAKNTNTCSPVDTPTRLLIIADEHIPYVRAFIDGLNSLKEGIFFPVLLGATNDVKDDLRLLKGNTSVIIGPPKRIIDHLRRKNLTLSKVRQFCIVEPSKVHDTDYFDSFDNDLLYLDAKVPGKAKKLLVCSRTPRLEQFRENMTRHKRLTDEDLSSSNQAVFYRAAELSPQVISDYIYAQQMREVQIIASYPKMYARLDAYFSNHPTLYTVTLKHLSQSATIPTTAQHILYAGLPLEEERIIKMSSMNPVVAGTHHIIYTARDATSVIPIQENYHMSKRFESPNSEEVLAGKIKLLVETVEKDSNPEELNNLKRLIKKNVPFYRRGYLTAFLLRQYLNGGTAADAKKAPRTRARKAAPAPTFNEEDSTTLFFGVGRSRRTYPKDLTKLITTETGLAEDVILAIKALENYSFVTVKKESADAIIEKLNGLKYKGRALVVNPAKSKK